VYDVPFCVIEKKSKKSRQMISKNFFLVLTMVFPLALYIWQHLSWRLIQALERAAAAGGNKFKSHVAHAGAYE